MDRRDGARQRPPRAVGLWRLQLPHHQARWLRVVTISTSRQQGLMMGVWVRRAIPPLVCPLRPIPGALPPSPQLLHPLDVHARHHAGRLLRKHGERVGRRLPMRAASRPLSMLEPSRRSAAGNGGPLHHPSYPPCEAAAGVLQRLGVRHEHRFPPGRPPQQPRVQPQPGRRHARVPQRRRPGPWNVCCGA